MSGHVCCGLVVLISLTAVLVGQTAGQTCRFGDPVPRDGSTEPASCTIDDDCESLRLAAGRDYRHNCIEGVCCEAPATRCEAGYPDAIVESCDDCIGITSCDDSSETKVCCPRAINAGGGGPLPPFRGNPMTTPQTTPQPADPIGDEAECVGGQVFNHCGTPCPRTCDLTPTVCATVCVPQCECPAGTVWHEEAGRCIDPKDCPPKVPQLCPQLLCLHNCPHGYMKDENNCLTCNCKLPQPCPQVWCPYNCPEGYQRDSNGCLTCNCLSLTSTQRCPQIMCPIPCIGGTYAIDDKGCTTCRCVPFAPVRTPQCPQVRCSSQCELGYKTDNNGCQTCECRTLCHKMLAEVESAIGAYKPMCEEDGKFSRRQCHSSTGYCWCVDTVTGIEISGTRARGDVTCLEDQGGASTPDTCSLPPSRGRCLGLFKRYFYNAKSGSCETFSYGGCEGNKNNFETYEECAQACAPSSVQQPVECRRVRCRMACPYGWKKDENGCDICQCVQGPVFCQPVLCRMACPYGYVKDANGCDICQCNRAGPVACRPVRCGQRCPYGYEQDEHGCDTCQCKRGWIRLGPRHGGLKSPYAQPRPKDVYKRPRQI